jgi:hypothetical protein
VPILSFVPRINLELNDVIRFLRRIVILLDKVFPIVCGKDEPYHPKFVFSFFSLCNGMLSFKKKGEKD